MSTPSKPVKKQTVELQPGARPSRIRREPVRADAPAGPVSKFWTPSEWESWVVVVGTILFALALSALSIGVSAITSN